MIKQAENETMELWVKFMGHAILIQERRRYIVKSSLISCVHSQNGPSSYGRHLTSSWACPSGGFTIFKVTAELWRYSRGLTHSKQMSLLLKQLTYSAPRLRHEICNHIHITWYLTVNISHKHMICLLTQWSLRMFIARLALGYLKKYHAH